MVLGDDERGPLASLSRGEIHPTVTARELGEINEVFDEMSRGAIDGRVVVRY